MRSFIIFTLLTVILSCQDGIETPLIPYKGAQAKLNSIADAFDTKILEAGNSAQKTVLRDSCMHALSSFLMDSLPKHTMRDFLIRIDNVQTIPLNGKYDLVVEASDNHFKYWMEIDYGSQKAELADSVYNDVVKFKEGATRKTNMFYFREIEQGDKYKVRVVFLPDSLKN